MDAAKTHFTKTVLFLTIALLLAAPFAAQAQPAFTSGLTATPSGNQAGCVTVTGSADGVTPITFTVNAPNTLPQFYITPSGGQTPLQICFQIANPGLASGTQTTNMTLTASSPSGVANGNIAVIWNPTPSGGGGNPNGATVSPSSLTMVYPAVGNFTLSSAVNSGNVNYNIGINYQTGANWLSVAAVTGSGNTNTGQSGFLLPGNSQSFTASGNPTGLANGVTYTANIVISLSGAGSGGFTIPVSFSVGNGSGGNGTLTANPNPVNLNYNTGSGQAPFQGVTLTSSTGLTTFNATVTAGQSWMLVNGQTSAFGLAVSNGLSITTVLGNLPTANATGTIQLSDSNSNVLNTITVNLTINGASNGLTLSPSPVTLTAAAGTTPVSTNVTISSNASGNLAITGISGSGISAVLNSSSITAGGTASMTVTGNPTNLGTGTYQGSVTVTLNSTQVGNNTVTQTVNVNFNVGSGSGGVSGIVAPTSLQFNYQQNGSTTSLQPQTVTNGVTGAFTVGSVTTSNGGNWLVVNPTAGTGPAPINVSVTNVAGMATGSYSGSFTVTTPAGSQNVSVSLLIAASPVLFYANGQTTLSYTSGGATSTTFQVLSSDSSAIPISGAASSQSWLTVQQLNANTPAGFSVSFNPAALTNGVNLANITINSSAANAQLIVPIVINASGISSGGGLLTPSPGSLAFTLQATTSQQQTLNVSSSSGVTYTAFATVTTPSGGNWLSVSPSAGSLQGNTTTPFTVTATAGNLPNGTYSGAINFQANGLTQPAVPVTLTVTGSTTGGGTTGPLTANPTSLAFNYASGGVTGSPGFNVTSSSGTVQYTVTATTSSGGNWLSTTAQATNFTPGTLSASISTSVVAGLSPGTYNGNIALTSGTNVTNIQVTLTVQGNPVVSAGPANLSLTYQAGSANTPTATIQVTGNAPNLSFTAIASSSGWLNVSPTTGTTGTNGQTLQVATNPAGLAAGNYSGTIVVSGLSGATGSTTISVTLSVTAPLPTIQAVVNAASGASGAVSPGEIVSIFGPSTNPIGPGTPATLTLDSTGKVSTNLGGVQVLFGGIPAPLTYVSATQINAVVPYGIAGLFAPFVQVRYLNQNSNSFVLTTAATAPGLFALAGGTGQGAIVNQDGSVNGPGHAAPKGSTVLLYATGEGATNPPGVTGSVTCSAGCSSISQIPVPLLPVTVTFIDQNGGRYPANYAFAGEAPNFVAGVMQVNAIVPANVPSGTLQVIVGVGGNTTQSGVTLLVQ